MDPLTAFSTVGTVLQVVESGAKVVNVAIEYANNQGSTEVSAIETYVQTLIASNSELQDKLKTYDDISKPGSARALWIANKQCLDVSQELVRLLDFLKPKTEKRWKYVALALRRQRAQSQLEKLCARLESVKSNLAVCFMVYTLDQNRKEESWKTKDDLYGPSIATLEQLAGEVRFIKETARSDRMFESKLEHLFEAIEKSTRTKSKSGDWFGFDMEQEVDYDLQRDSETDPKGPQELTRGEGLGFNLKREVGSDRREEYHLARAREDISSSINKVIDRLDHKFQTEDIKDGLTNLQSKIELELQIRTRILNSLMFDKMEDRMRNIKRAHSETFRWMLQDTEDLEREWDNFVTWISTDTEDTVYWIRGKPGSGKSTLVREVVEELKGSKKIKSWRNANEMLIATVFFWNAGTSLQKSMRGLLQTLIHQVFMSRLDLVHDSVTDETWQAYHPDYKPRDWSVDELRDVLSRVVTQMENETAVLFVIDGMDEFDGNDEERLDLLDFLRSLTTERWVKLCISSRPWNIYKDAFETCPQLRLEDLTRNDIEKFVSDSFTNDKLLIRKCGTQKGLVTQLTSQIADYADGVFLWVRLVVRELQKAVRDGCPPKRLSRVLDSIPRDLDDYFTRMLHQLDPTNRCDAAMIMKLMLCDLSYVSLQDNQQVEGPTLRLFDLLHLDDDADNDYFVLDDHYRAVDLASYSYELLREEFDTLERRLTSRSMGLMEVSHRFFNQDDMVRSEINFMHRTVKDFLCTPRASTVLESFLSRAFDPLAYRCSTLIDRCLPLEKSLSGFFHEMLGMDQERWVRCFLYWGKSPQLDTGKMIASYFRIAPPTQFFQHFRRLSAPKTVLPEKPGFSSSSRVAARLEASFLSLAIQHKWKAFIDYVVTQQPRSNLAMADVMLDLTLRPCPARIDPPRVEMVSYILSLGADPNTKCVPRKEDGAGVGTHPYAATSTQMQSPMVSIWIQFLADIVNFSLVNIDEISSVLTSIIKILISAKVPHHVSIDLLESCLRSTTTKANFKRIWGTQFDPDSFCQYNEGCHDAQIPGGISLIQYLRNCRGIAFSHIQLDEVEFACQQAHEQRSSTISETPMDSQ